jgi:uncharacterized protein YukE
VPKRPFRLTSRPRTQTDVGGVMNELLGANTDTLDRMAESLGPDARGLQDIGTRAQQVVAELQAAWNGPDLWRLTQQWEQQGIPGLASASISLDTCASQLRAQSSAQREASSCDGSSSGSVLTWLAPGRRPWHPGACQPWRGLINRTANTGARSWMASSTGRRNTRSDLRCCGCRRRRN